MDIEESLETIGLDIHSIVDEAIQLKLESLTEEQLLDIL
jgi:hypothetical protein